MEEKKSWGSAVLGWFIVRDDQAGDPVAVPADASAGTPAGDVSSDSTPQPVFFQKEPPPAPGGQVNFDAVFEAAGIAGEERQRVDKALELVASLPANTDAAVKKQIVEASLKAFGVPIEKIIESGAGEIQALEGYIRAGAADTRKLLDESNERIKQYEEEIQRIRLVMDQRVQEQQAVTSACNAKKLQVQQILEFFGRDAVSRVVSESPRLHDPSASAGSGT